MNVSPLSLGVGIALVILYALSHMFKFRTPPNLGAMFVLFMSGPVIDQAWDVITVVYRLGVEKKQLEAGVFKDHIFVIAFTAIALIYAVLDALYANFRHFFPAKPGTGGAAGGGSNDEAKP